MLAERRAEFFRLYSPENALATTFLGISEDPSKAKVMVEEQAAWSFFHKSSDSPTLSFASRRSEGAMSFRRRR